MRFISPYRRHYRYNFGDKVKLLPSEIIVLNDVDLTSILTIIHAKWIGNFIREQEGDIFYCDWKKVCFTIKENNYKEFIDDLKPKLIIAVKKRDMQARRIILK